MADLETRPREGESGDKQLKLDQWRLDIQRDADAMADQRDKANEDMRFINVTGGMWEGFLEDDFVDRAKLEFDLVSNYIYRYFAEWNTNRMGVVYKPDDSATSDDDAELLNGIYRADFRDGSGKIAVDNAVYEAAVCGYGAYKLSNVFEDEGDPENELQRIKWIPIYNAFNTVYWDVAAQRIDKRDARWVTVLTQFTRESFEEAFPGKDPVSAYQPDTRLEFNYFGTTRPTQIYIATRYEIIKKKSPVWIYDNFITEQMEVYNEEEYELVKDELAQDENRKFRIKRMITRQFVEKTVFSGAEILEPTKRIAGKWLPVVPVYGYRMYVDAVEWYKGLVRNLKDAARLFNMQVSQLAENSASNGQEKPIFDPAQMPDKVKNVWAELNNKPYLLAKSLRDVDGNYIHHGPTGYLKPAQLDGSTAALMELVPAFIKDTTGGAPQDTLDPDASGKAINAIIKRMNMNTQPITDNISMAIESSGWVYQSKAAEVYNRQQMVRTLSEDGTDGQEQLLKVVIDERTGKHVFANNLRGKKFRVYADVGPQYETLKEQTVENLKGMGEMLQSAPGGEQYMPAIVATMLDNMDGVGLGPLKELNRRNMLLQGLVEPENEEEEEMLAKASQPQPDPNQVLIESIAEKERAEARNMDSDSVDNIASAQKKAAETQKIQAETAKVASETRQGEAKTIAELRKQVFEEAQALPF